MKLTMKKGENALKFANLFKDNPNVFIPKFEKSFHQRESLQPLGLMESS